MKTKLQAARVARSWTQSELMDELEAVAKRLRRDLPGRDSLKTQISYFENGRRSVGPEYQLLLREVYQATNAELGFPDESPVLSQVLELPAPSTVAVIQALPNPANPAIISYLQSVFVQHCIAEPVVGPRFLVPPVQSQMPLIEQLCQTARGSLREDALRVGARYAEFLGWLHQDSGNVQSAMHWTARALDYAQELDDRVLSSYIQQRRSNIATEAGQPGHGLGLARAALSGGRDLPFSVRAVALRQLANAHALLGEEAECHATLDDARTAAEQGASEHSDLAGYCTVAYIDMEAANCDVRLRRPTEAVDVFRASLARWPDGQERDRGLCQARLASANAILGDVEGAYRAAQEALVTAQTTGSARILQELSRMEGHLTPWQKLVEVAEFKRTLHSLRGAPE